MARGDDLMDGRHADQVGTQNSQHADLGGRFVRRTGHGDVDTLTQARAKQTFGDSRREVAQGSGIRLAHVDKTRSQSLVVGTAEWRRPGQVDVISDGDDLADRVATAQGHRLRW